MKKKSSAKRTSIKKKPALTPPRPSESFYIVGIGSSAGGLEAIEKFFQNMPDDAGLAYIVVSHLDPTHVSIMPELIQKQTKMKLFQAEDGMKVKPNQVYVTPPNRDIAILHGTIQLIEPLEAHGFRLPIDSFFKSLSEDSGEKAICIILSGMASDGTAGLRAIKSELGMVMVQDPKSAKFDGMPTSAINTGLADYILPPEEMPAQLIKYTSAKVKNVLLDQSIAKGIIPDAVQKIFILLRAHTGHDFSLYKQSTIYRRVERRMTISQLDTLADYVRLLQGNLGEIDSLFQELLIGVTSFFRDPESFVELKKVLLELVKNKPINGQIRVWVPGCSTGEEAYSIAIILKECMEELRKHLNVQIFATDIDSNAIDKARIGTYTGIEKDVSKERLNRYFNVNEKYYQVKKEIREILIFAPQSVIKDPPFTKLDFISCRNLLIYFTAELQKKTIPLFHYSLLPDGILVLGPSETISGFVDLFSLADKKWKFYKRRDSVFSAQPYIEFPISHIKEKSYKTNMEKTEIKDITQLAEKIILQNYSLNCVIINEKGDILYIHGKTGKYLELSHGVTKINIIEMAREGLREELQVVIRKVLSGRKSLTVHGISIKSSGITQHINLTVKPIKEPEVMKGSLLIVFEDIIQHKKEPSSKNIRYEKKSEQIIKELGHELKSTREYLQSTIEELKSSNEELKSSNEELQSTNEEIQSSNEELETSKEELQSLNEELITVNTELQNKNDELSVVSNDMKNLLDSSEIPTIFLDNELCIKRFTSNSKKAINLISSDVGRPISHISTNLKYNRLIDDIQSVLNTLVYKEVELQTNESIWYLMRILPYRTMSNYIDGVVITFTDINNSKIASEEITKLNKDLQLANEYSNNIFDTVRDSLLVLDANLIILSANKSFYKTFNTVKEKTIGKYIYDLNERKWDIPKLRQLLEQMIAKKDSFDDFEVDYELTKGSSKKLLLNARRIFNADKGTKLILLAINDGSTK